MTQPGGVERRLSGLRREERSIRLEEKFVVRDSGCHRTMERSLQEFGRNSLGRPGTKAPVHLWIPRNNAYEFGAESDPAPGGWIECP